MQAVRAHGMLIRVLISPFWVSFERVEASKSLFNPSNTWRPLELFEPYTLQSPFGSLIGGALRLSIRPPVVVSKKDGSFSQDS